LKNGSEFKGQSVSDIRDVVSVLGNRLKVAMDSSLDTEGITGKLQSEIEN